jgi:hypothetical protein
MHCSSEAGHCCCAMSGFAGNGAAVIELSAEDVITSMPIESPLGAFVVTFDGERPAVARVLDSAGDVIVMESFEGHGLWLTTGT